MFALPSAEERATWPAPNYVDPVTRQPLVLGIQIPITVLVAVFISLRFYSRAIVVKAVGADDWFMLAAALTAIATSIMTCISTTKKFQTGYHLWDVTAAIVLNPSPTAKIGIATQMLFVPITACTKVSVLLTYLRIFASRSNIWFCYTMLAFTAAWTVLAFCLALFQCTPIDAYWKPYDHPNATCIPVPLIYYPTGILNIISDFLIFLWPAKELAQVQLPLKQRITLIAMFTVGITICVAGVCRVWYTSVYVRSYDILWHGATLFAIITIENGTGIICGCIPACRPIISRALSRTSSKPSTPRPNANKSKTTENQSFPFQSISGGIPKSVGCSIEYDDAQDPYQRSAVDASVRGTRRYGDRMGEGSEECIIMPHHLVESASGETLRD